MHHCHPNVAVGVCVLQVSCARLCPTWTGRPRTSTWCCFRPRTWEVTWEDYPGPPPSPSGSLTSTTILHASLRVSNSAAHAAAHREQRLPGIDGQQHNRKKMIGCWRSCTHTVCCDNAFPRAMSLNWFPENNLGAENHPSSEFLANYNPYIDIRI